MDTFSRYQHSRTASNHIQGVQDFPSHPKQFELALSFERPETIQAIRFFQTVRNDSDYPNFSSRSKQIRATRIFRAVRIFRLGSKTESRLGANFKPSEYSSTRTAPTIHTSKNVNYLIMQWCIYYLRLHVMTLCTYLLSKCSSLSQQ